MLKKIQKFTSSKRRLRLSCTGYASQNLSNDKIEVGTVYIGIGVGTKSKIIEKKFKNKFSKDTNFFWNIIYERKNYM